MQEYRAYILGSDGHIQSRVDLVCADERAAKEQAKQLVDGHDVELWQGTLRIATFPHHAMSAKTLRHWTDEEDRRLLELKAAGKSVIVIAKILGRTEVAIANRLDVLKANRDQPGRTRPNTG